MKKEINIKDVKYVFFDMDGTLLTSSRTISPKTLQIIEKLRKSNISCSIITGRPYYFAMNEIKTIKPHLPIISCNGALIFDPLKKQLISRNSIDKEISKKIFNILIENDAVFLIYTSEKMWSYKNDVLNPTSSLFDWIDENNHMLPKDEQIVISKIDDVSSFDITNFDVAKFLLIYSEMPVDKYFIVKDRISNFNEIYTVKSQKGVLDIMPSGLSKGWGLKKLHDENLINLNNTLVFGDEENDLSMFEVAKWSVAMGNAQDKVKSAATFVCESNDNDGIASFFNILFNDEK